MSASSKFTLRHIPGGPYPKEWNLIIEHGNLWGPDNQGLFPPGFSVIPAQTDDDGDFYPTALELAYWLLVLTYLVVWWTILGLVLRRGRSQPE